MTSLLRRAGLWAGLSALAAWAVAAADTPDARPAKLSAESIKKAKDAKDKDDDKEGDDEKKFKPFAEVTKGAQKLDGLFRLYRKDEHLYAEIKPDQLNEPFLAPMAIARGLKQAGHPLNFGDEWVLVFRRVGDKLHLLRRNIHYKAPEDSPLGKAVKQAYTDSVLLALPIISIDTDDNGVLIDLADIFLTDFAELPLGGLDRGRTTWHKVKAFPNNLELEVEATYSGMGRFSLGGEDDGVADSRGITVVIHYSLVKPPGDGYKARLADDRVGHFLSAVKDFGRDDPDSAFARQINRWRLEKADPKAKLSPPKKQIVWYIEDTVPVEYRPFVQEGILEWNKAFEKIGYRDAIAVRWVEAGRDEFDPEDINYCTFRWITADSTYAMSGLRANPLTGEMIDGDVVFDASWIRAWKTEYALLTGQAPPTEAGMASGAAPLAIGRVISPIMAGKLGYGRPAGAIGQANGPRAVPASATGPAALLARRAGRGPHATCTYSAGMSHQLGLAAIALADRDVEAGEDGDGEKADESKGDTKKDKPKEKKVGPKLPDELLGQGIKMVVMHEVGHSLGLRHNFQASTMLKPEELHNPEITRKRGLCGSVMDYMPINLAPPGTKQGDYFTTTIGPYDYWAIEYAYKAIDGDEDEELKKVAARSPEPGLTYATDEDLFASHDPTINLFDYSSDPLGFARDRLLLASSLMKDLDGKVVRDGESWHRLRRAFDILLGQWADAAFIASEHVGGQRLARDHKGTKGARDPITPVDGAKQREALAFVVENVLSDKSFRFSPALLRRLASERWYHWGSEGFGFDEAGVRLHDEVLAIQQIVLGQCLGADALARVLDGELTAPEGSKPLALPEVFRALTDGIWAECPAEAPKGDGVQVAASTIRRNLQRAHLKRLSTMVLGERSGLGDDSFGFIFFYRPATVPPDAKSLARRHLKEIDGRIRALLEAKNVAVDETTRAHLDECHERIAKVLNAALDAREP